jgi:16S rRNA (uracil1498-N3)-methyltransferase
VRRRRLVVPQGTLDGDTASVSGDLHHYLSRVLRLKPGVEIELVDGAGAGSVGQIERITAQETCFLLTSPLPPRLTEPRPRLTLLYGLSRRTRTELVLQKATELGVAWILPVVCERSVSRPKRGERKLERWLEIVGQAARQCGRRIVPLVSAPTPFAAALGEVGDVEHRLLAAAGGGSLSDLGPELAAADHLALAVGPEGGFSNEELEAAGEAGFRQVSLGRLVLRTETAAIAGLTLLAFLSGRLEG